MKKLTLVRHAKSSWKYPELSDFDRPLNKRGKRDLPEVAQRLLEQEIIPDQIFSSSAKRAMKTTEAISACLNLKGDQVQEIPELYEACAETLKYLLQNLPESIRHIMIIGHNPGLERLCFDLTQEIPLKFPTAAVAHMHLSITQWHELADGCATLTYFDYPKKHLPPK